MKDWQMLRYIMDMWELMTEEERQNIVAMVKEMVKGFVLSEDETEDAQRIT